MYIEDKDIHKGHRSRMRSKLETYGPRIFDTYELLEMLLYYVVPYRDTNPIAKRLLAAFGSLDGVFNASVSELSEVDGIGEKCAEFISLAGRAIVEDAALSCSKQVPVFNDYNDVGRYFVSYFEKNPSTTISMALLDNGMRLIKIVDIPGDFFSSAAVKPKHFLDPVLSYSATIVIIAHKRYSTLFLSDGDLATDKLIRSELANIGVTVAEHYVVSGKDYSGVKTRLSFGDDSMPELERFYNSIPASHGGAYEEI